MAKKLGQGSKKFSPKAPKKLLPTLVKGDVVQLHLFDDRPGRVFDDMLGLVRRVKDDVAYVYVPGMEEDYSIPQDKLPLLVAEGNVILHKHVPEANVLHVIVVADEAFQPQHVIVRDSGEDYTLAGVDETDSKGSDHYLLDEYIRARLLIDPM